MEGVGGTQPTVVRFQDGEKGREPGMQVVSGG